MDQLSRPQLFTRRSFMAAGGVFAAGGALSAALVTNEDLEITRPVISLPNLPEAFHGFRIAQLNDVHYDEFTRDAYMNHVIDGVNSLNADAVVLTGDFVTRHSLLSRHPQDWANKSAAVLSQIRCPRKYAVLGNHDVDVNEGMIIDALTQHGIEVLQNRNLAIEKDGRRLWFAGTGDVYTHRVRLEDAIPWTAIRDNEAIVLLVHEPDYAQTVVKTAPHVGLMLSGHTHGGQIRIPFVGATVLPPLGRRYVEGHFRIGDMQLYVNRGLGTVGVPLRIDCRPEITLITLEARSTP